MAYLTPTSVNANGSPVKLAIGNRAIADSNLAGGGGTPKVYTKVGGVLTPIAFTPAP